ncbi:MAG: hypothetical protein LCH63_02460 [Candidatus Melainabacteria bacterium]|nr:hypothetical protein [Candidatus Melainabacteria bacterium]
MNITFKITSRLLEKIRADLRRRHSFAYERVGFISAGLSFADGNKVLILARDYLPVEDEDYLPDLTVGALLGSEAIRKALQWSISKGNAVFHVHSHSGIGMPSFSAIDLHESSKFMLDFLKVSPMRLHGALVLSNDLASGLAVFDRNQPCIPVDSFVEVGCPIKKWSRT